jgi:hypothetical protein
MQSSRNNNRKNRELSSGWSGDPGETKYNKKIEYFYCNT